MSIAYYLAVVYCVVIIHISVLNNCDWITNKLESKILQNKK